MQNPEVFDLWSAGPPDGLLQHSEPEILNDFTGPDQRLNRVYSSVSQPSISVHLPVRQTASHSGVIILPGGGYQDVWIDKEGYDVARWLNALGLAAYVVKYRVLPGSVHGLPYEQVSPALWESVMSASLADGLRAVGWVRANCSQWQVDPKRIGVIGFSAGGHLILRMLQQSGAGDSGSPDPIQRVDSQPDFSILVYPGVPDDLSGLSPDTGPVFITQAADDALTPAAGVARLVQKLLDQDILVEAHIFRQGKHGFGLGFEGGAVRSWLGLCEVWLRELEYVVG